MENLPEFWMRGAVDRVPDLLQPVAHALLQMEEELNTQLADFDSRLLWEKPVGVASVGFHLMHISGVIDRMFTYAGEQPLSEEQLVYLKAETSIHEKASVSDLLQNVRLAVNMAVEKLKNIDTGQLTESRFLGRKKIPVTLGGLLFHAAEHSMRHLGQVLVTIQVVNSRAEEKPNR